MMILRLAGIIDGSPLPHVTAGDTTIKSILQILFAILGALAFFFIVIAGFRLILSSGEPNKVAEARRQIAYAAAGLILAAMASVMVNFALGRTG